MTTKISLLVQEAKKYRQQGYPIKAYDMSSEMDEVEAEVKIIRQSSEIEDSKIVDFARYQVGAIILDDFLFERFHIKTNVFEICESGFPGKDMKAFFERVYTRRHAYKDVEEFLEEKETIDSRYKFIGETISFLLRKHKERKDLGTLVKNNLGDIVPVADIVLAYAGDDFDEKRQSIVDKISEILFFLLAHDNFDVYSIVDFLKTV